MSNNKVNLKVPQVRILKALAPKGGKSPALTRDKLREKAGYSAISGTINRVLNGIPEGSSSGNPHPGLLALGLIKRVELDVDGKLESAYQITAKGIKALESYIEENGKTLKGRDKSACINQRYRGKE